ncbi:MAG TPA: T9SS type A sorting domain-containing protein [bacterium]|nr:T9SS type A sorting domain-containing protein [bacterium]
MRKSIFVPLVPVLAAALVSAAPFASRVGVPARPECSPCDSMLVKLDSIPSQVQYQCIAVRNDTVFCALQGYMVYYRDRLTGAVIDSFPTQSGASVIAICPFGDSICVSRIASPEFCEVYTLDGTYVRSFYPTGGVEVRGLDWDGSHFWATSFSSDLSIYLMTPDGTVTKTLSRSGGFPSTIARDLKLDLMFPNRLWTSPSTGSPNKLMYVAFDTSANTFTPLDTFPTGLSSYMSGIGFRNDSVDGGCVYVSSISLSWIYRFRVHAPQTGIEEPHALAQAFAFSVGPNPATGAVLIEYSLPGIMHEASSATLAMFDVNGRQVRSVRSAAAGPAHRHATWNLDDDSGRPVANGVYFCKLTSGCTTLSRKLVVQR